VETGSRNKLGTNLELMQWLESLPCIRSTISRHLKEDSLALFRTLGSQGLIGAAQYANVVIDRPPTLLSGCRINPHPNALGFMVPSPFTCLVNDLLGVGGSPTTRSLLRGCKPKEDEA